MEDSTDDSTQSSDPDRFGLMGVVVVTIVLVGILSAACAARAPGAKDHAVIVDVDNTTESYAEVHAQGTGWERDIGPSTAWRTSVAPETFDGWRRVEWQVVVHAPGGLSVAHAVTAQPEAGDVVFLRIERAGEDEYWVEAVLRNSSPGQSHVPASRSGDMAGTTRTEGGEGDE